jgi:hypothetical protein
MRWPYLALSGHYLAVAALDVEEHRSNGEAVEPTVDVFGGWSEMTRRSGSGSAMRGGPRAEIVTGFVALR